MTETPEVRRHEIPVFEMPSLPPEVIEDPYPFYEALRQQPPVEVANNLWFVARFDDVEFVALHHEIFSSERGHAFAAAAIGTVLFSADPPAHTRHRKIALAGFSARRTAIAMEQRIREITNELIDSFFAQGRIDFVSAFAAPLPVRVIAECLGLPSSEYATFQRWADNLVLPLIEMGQGRNFEGDVRDAWEKNIEEYQGYFVPQLEERLANPRDDVMSAMLTADVGAESPPSVEEVLHLVSHLIIAGHETTTQLLGSGMYLILRVPGVYEQLRTTPALIPKAVEEILRLESPVQNLFRVATRDVEVGGVTIPEGAFVVASWASANRDEAHFRERPATLDLEREDAVTHMAFGKGIHHCIGAPLARVEANIAFTQLLERLPSPRIPDEQEFRHRQDVGMIFRGFEELWVEWGDGHGQSKM
jgi:cytochrome P450